MSFNDKPLQYEQIVLDRILVYASAKLSRNECCYLQDLKGQLIEDIAGNLVVDIHAWVLGKRLPDIRYPATWWDHVKERWYPLWMLQRWPVQYTYITATAMYPTYNKILPGGHQPTFAFEVKQ